MKKQFIILAVLLSLGLSGCGTHTAPNLPRDTLPGDFMTETTAESETESVTSEQTSEAVTTAETSKETEPVTTAPETMALPENSEIVWSDESYILATQNHFSYALYNRRNELLYDFGYIAMNKPESVSTDSGKLTFLVARAGVNHSDIEISYPQNDLSVGETVYQDENFELRHTDDGWSIKSTISNYLIDAKVTSSTEPDVSLPIYTDGERVVCFFWSDTKELLRIYASDGITSSTITTVTEAETTEWHGNRIVTDSHNDHLFFDKNGKFRLFFYDYDMVVYHENLLSVENDMSSGYISRLYNTDLEPISEKVLVSGHFLPDGNFVAISSETYKNFVIYDANGNLVKKSRDYDKAMMTVYDERVADYGAFVLVNDGGKLKLIDTSENVVAEYEGYEDDWFFHVLISDYHEKSDGEYPPAYYFIFEDRDDTNGKEDTSAEYEFWYAPDTGESGTIKNYIEGGFAYAKPVLYLYPEETTDVTVQFEHPERLTTVYPAYNNGWTVTASPDGNLFDGRRNYYALYWEENSDFMPDFRTGFIVDGDYAEFLEDKLDKIGLTEREANEFIMYWLPILEKNGRSVVWFELTESREAGNKLLISPEPDSLLRVAIHIKRADSKTKVIEQVLPHFERKGFTAVEWGGRVYE